MAIILEIIAIVCVAIFFCIGCFMAIVVPIIRRRSNKSKHGFQEPASEQNHHTLDLEQVTTRQGSQIDRDSAQHHFL